MIDCLNFYSRFFAILEHNAFEFILVTSIYSGNTPMNQAMMLKSHIRISSSALWIKKVISARPFPDFFYFLFQSRKLSCSLLESCTPPMQCSISFPWAWLPKVVHPFPEYFPSSVNQIGKNEISNRLSVAQDLHLSVIQTSCPW